MEIIIDLPKTGKTKKAIEWLKEKPNRILVVINEKEKERLLRDFGLKYNQVETADTVQNHYYGPTLEMKELAFDNLDLILKNLFPRCNVGLVTMTKMVYRGRDDNYRSDSDKQ